MAPCRCDLWEFKGIFPNYRDLAFIQQNKSDAVSHENKQHDTDQIFSNVKAIYFDVKCYAIIHVARDDVLYPSLLPLAVSTFVPIKTLRFKTEWKYNLDDGKTGGLWIVHLHVLMPLFYVVTCEKTVVVTIRGFGKKLYRFVIILETF